MARLSFSNPGWPTILVIGALSSAAVTLGCAGLTGPSPARVGCLNDCGVEKDSCMLNATSSDAIQECDAASRECSNYCPR